MATESRTTGFDPLRMIENHQAGVWRYLRALGCDHSQADDLTQETFLTVLRKPFQDYNAAATAAYLRRVAHNLFISARRRASRVVVMENLEWIGRDWTRWAGADNGDDLLEALRVCLRTLSERARWALDLRFRDKLSRAGIADRLQITEHGAKNLMQRAKKQLRRCVEGKMQ